MLNRPSESSTAASDTEGLAGIGAELLAARLARGEELSDVAEYLRIKTAYLEALERGDAKALPAGPYAAGFLKAYADYLRLPSAHLLVRLKATQRATAPAFEPAIAAAHAGEGRRPAVAIGIAGALLVAGLIGGYTLVGGRTPPEEIVALPPDLPPEPEPLDVMPPPVVAAVEVPAAAPAALPAVPPVAPPAGDAASAVAAERVEAPAPPPPPTAIRVAALAIDVEALPPAPPEEAGRVVLVARESSWVQVESTSRDFVRTRTLQPGERMALPDRADLALWTGNAGGIELLVDGRTVGLAGAPGAVIRSLPLAPESLIERGTVTLSPTAAAAATP